MNSRKEKIAKKIIKHKHNKEVFDKFDKYLKLTTVKIIELIPVKEVDGGKVYRVEYKQGLNIFNPLSCMIFITLMLCSLSKEFYEILKDNIREFKLCTYVTRIKIRDEV